MRFLILLVTALLVRFTPLRRGIHPDPARLWATYSAALAQRRPGWAGVAMLLLPLVPLELAFWLLNGVAHGFFVLLLGVFVLLLGLGGNDLLHSFGQRFEQAWARGDKAAAAMVAENEMGLLAEDEVSLLARVRGRMLTDALRGYFVPVLWFLLLGPLGALGYRLLRLFVERLPADDRTYITSLVHAMEWLPARLLAASFALVGHFDQVFGALRGLWGDWDSAIEPLLVTAAEAALSTSEQPGEDETVLAPIRALLFRAMLVWAVPVALLALLG
ncbi:MAG: regulatory signaling modulator protein AmpE [Halopseudomonas sp.]|uniref:regulatory signaling modulator protein AmpE n=1 Tax=Halopseudomonas sp. TaxID=2901191 RepID=UPI003001225D